MQCNKCGHKYILRLSDKCPRCGTNIASKKVIPRDPYYLGGPFIAALGLCTGLGRTPGFSKERHASIISHLMMAGASAEKAYKAIQIVESSAEQLRYAKVPFSDLNGIAQREYDLLKPDLQSDQFVSFALGLEFSLVQGICYSLKSMPEPGEDPPDEPPSDVIEFLLGLFFLGIDAKVYSKRIAEAKDCMKRHLDNAIRHATTLSVTRIDFSSLIRLLRECTTRMQFVSLWQVLAETGTEIVNSLSYAKGYM